MENQSSEEEIEISDLTTLEVPSLLRQISQDTPIHPPEIEETPVLQLPEAKSTFGQFSLDHYLFTDFPPGEDPLDKFEAAEYSFCQVTKPEVTVSKPPTTEDSVSQFAVSEYPTCQVTKTEATVSEPPTEDSVSQFTVSEYPVCQVTKPEATISKPPTTEDSVSQLSTSEATFSNLTATDDSVSHLTTSEVPVPHLETEESLFLRSANPVKDFFRNPVASTSKSSTNGGSKTPIEKDEDYPCPICGERFILEDLLRFHLINDHSQPIPSTSTFQPTRVIKPLKTYRKQPQTDKNSVCSICLRKFPSEEDLKRHSIDAHNVSKNFFCRICTKMFARKCDLTKHGIFHHKTSTEISLERSFLCEYCGSGFTAPCFLKLHIEMCHAFPCCCRKTFFREKSLKKHQKVCMEKARIEAMRSFTCDICGDTFTSRNNLHYHLRTHPRNQRFTCPACARSFSSQLHFLLHRNCQPKCSP